MLTCAICSRKLQGNQAADHCHKTGAIRDWLCVKCNAGLGFFEDDPERMRAAAAYIERHAANPTSPLAFIRGEYRRCHPRAALEKRKPWLISE